MEHSGGEARNRRGDSDGRMPKLVRASGARSAVHCTMSYQRHSLCRITSPIARVRRRAGAWGISFLPIAMTWLRRVSDGVSRLLGGQPNARELGLQRPDFVAEGLALERANDLDAALTSYRLALRSQPEDPRILLSMAIVFTKSGRADEAVRSYRKILDAAPTHPGANYGIAFLLLKRGDMDGAMAHLETFLAAAPSGAENARWISHAQATLRDLRGDVLPGAEAPVEDSARAPIDTPVRHAAIRDMTSDEHGASAPQLRATGTDGLRHGNDR
jgi:tetratricopeptide (TPR) repeat protein